LVRLRVERLGRILSQFSGNEKGRLGGVRGVFPVIAGKDVGVDEGVQIAIDGVIQAFASSGSTHGIAQGGHILKELVASPLFHIVQLIDQWIGQEQTVTRKKLRISHDGISAGHPKDEGGILSAGKLI